MNDDLVAVLSTAKHLPRAALEQALADPEAIAGPVLEAVERAGSDLDALSDEQADLLFWGIHVLAGARDGRLYRPLLHLLRGDAEILDALLGDAVGTTLARVIASSFNGDPEPLQRFVLDSTLDGFIRNEAILALAFLTRDSRIPLEQTRDLLVRFDENQIAVETDIGWTAWEEAIAYLGLAELAPRVDAARRDGRLNDEHSDPIWFRRALRRAQTEPPDLSDFPADAYGYLDDPIAALAWTAEDAGMPIINPFKDVGRNDPCPCGSGKKFKKCCLDKADSMTPLPGLH